VLLALQFAAFGWRIAREIKVGDENRRTWFPVSDYLNIFSMFTLVLVAIVLPLANHQNPQAIRLFIAIAATLIAFHPINVAAHYRLFAKGGRSVYKSKQRDIPLITDQEWFTLAMTGIALAIVAWQVL
jgi:hypothetical protein